MPTTMDDAPQNGTPILAWGAFYDYPQVVVWREGQWVATWNYEPFADAYAWELLPDDPTD